MASITTMPSLPLSAEFIHTIIDNVLASQRSISLSRSSDHETLFLRRVKTSHEWNSLSYALPKEKEIDDELRIAKFSADVRTPFYFGIQAVCYDSVHNEEKLVGFCTFYIAYSTWDGRILYIDKINTEKDRSPSLYQVVAKIATDLRCSRLTWKVRIDDSADTNDSK